MGIYAIGLIGHVGGGKTSLGDAMLFTAGQVAVHGSVAQGTSALDQDEDAKERQSSTHSSVAYCDWDSHRIEIVDTPGSANFIEGAVAAARVIDGAVMVASAEPGIQSQVDQFMELLDAQGVPRCQLDRQICEDLAVA